MRNGPTRGCASTPGPGVRGEADLHDLIAFFRARRGAAVGFRLEDPFDNSSNGMTARRGRRTSCLAWATACGPSSR